MNNVNALIAMAQVSENSNNPYKVFCNYIKYCICTKNYTSLTLKDIIDLVGNEFGLRLPHNIALYCLQILEKEGFVKANKHMFERIGEFDTKAFEDARLKYKATEQEIIKELISYVEKYNKIWTEEYAREQLVKVLDKKGLAFDIFIGGTPNAIQSSFWDELNNEEIVNLEASNNTDDTTPLFSDTFFVGRFIQELLKNDTVKRAYLISICEGLMVCIGAYQFPSAESKNVKSNIKGTAFYFDTRLLLRFIGCAGESAVAAARELVKLIQSSGGNIYYFPQTLEEMERAFEDAITSLSNGNPPYDEEMRLYALSINNSKAILSTKKATFKNELSKSNIYFRGHTSFSEGDRIRFGFDKDTLKVFMQSKLNWDTRTIDNDALAIWETHMLRGGNYNEYCGTSERLPVFVTTNSQLISIALGFHDEYSSSNGICKWKANRLPVITDIRLTCRLWDPSSQSERLSLLYLTSNAVAALKPSKRYLNGIRELVNEIKKSTPEYASISLPAFFDDNVTDAVLEATLGEENNFNIGTFASSMAELAELKAREQEALNVKISEERDAAYISLNEQTQTIIADAVSVNKNKLGIYALILRLVVYSNILLPVIFSGIFSIISACIGNLVPVIITVLLSVTLSLVEKLICANFFVKALLKRILPKCIKKYKAKITKRLRISENKYSEEILHMCEEQNTLIKKCKNILEKE